MSDLAVEAGSARFGVAKIQYGYKDLHKKRPVHRVIRRQALIIWGKILYGLTATNCCLAAVIRAVFSADLAADLALKA